MKKNIFVALFAITLAGCSKKKIEITSEYIINEYWDRHSNAIEISRQKLKKDSVINPFLELSQVDILRKLEVDSSFVYRANAKINHEGNYKARKVYFNRDNGFYWQKGFFGKEVEDTVKVIGNLKKGSWYKFAYLVTYPYYVYVYVDSLNKMHQFDVNLANY